MNPRIKIEPSSRRTVRAVTYRIDGLAVVRLSQQLDPLTGSGTALPVISWLGGEPSPDLSYLTAFVGCLELAQVEMEAWKSDTESVPSHLKKSVALSNQPLWDILTGEIAIS